VALPGAEVECVSVCAVDAEPWQVWPTGVGELDRVLGGGVVPGSAVLVGGEPGVGKSTLLLDLAARAAAAGQRVVYVSAEESLGQVAARAARIGANHPDLKLAAATELGQIQSVIGTEKPQLLVVDSIQTVAGMDVEGVPGGVTQVRAVAGQLVRAAKASQMACFLVGHVTKDGSLAGPRTIEHLVDAVVLFEGDKHGELRWLRVAKNRFGSSEEVGCFRLSEVGIHEVTDPGGLFLDNLEQPGPGVCSGVALDGRRPLAVSVQALAAGGAKKGKAERRSQGIDAGRLALVLAVLQSHANIGLRALDLYVSTVGGIKCLDPTLDLPLALACVSARLGLAVPKGTVALGEVGLGGQIRPVKGLAKRLAEAERLGFTRAVVPLGSVNGLQSSLDLFPVSHIQPAIQILAEPCFTDSGQEQRLPVI
jgi:DNA repair protein RadA/Sms